MRTDSPQRRPRPAVPPRSSPGLQYGRPAEKGRGRQLLALSLLTESSLVQLAAHPTGHLLLGTIVALQPNTYALVAATWICKNMSNMVASHCFAQFASTVLQLILQNSRNPDCVLILERWVLIVRFQMIFSQGGWTSCFGVRDLSSWRLLEILGCKRSWICF